MKTCRHVTPARSNTRFPRQHAQTSMTSPAAVTPPATLSREHAELLVELAVAVHKNAIYPPSHPLLVVAVDGLARRLASLLEESGTISIGVARRQLVIEGVASDAAHPILRELAQRLHHHQLGALRVSRGVSRDELADALATLSVDAGRVDRPLGLQGNDVLRQWEHVQLFALSFEQLELIDQEPSDETTSDEADDLSRSARTRAAQLWIGLARAALATEGTAAPRTDPDAVAGALDAHQGDAVYDQVVVGYLLQIAKQLRNEQGKPSEMLKQNISRTVRGMKPETLKRLLGMGGDAGQRREFMLDATRGLEADAVVEMVRAAADVSDQHISRSTLRLLAKLAAHAERGTSPSSALAEEELREHVQRLIGDWEMDDANPEDYGQALRTISHVVPSSFDVQSKPCEPERILEMALQIGVVGPSPLRALDEIRAREDLLPLLDLLEGSPDTPARQLLGTRALTPELLQELIARAPATARAAERVAVRLGAPSLDLLIDALEEADDKQSTWLADTIVRLGDVVAAPICDRLRALRPSAQRALLTVLDRLGGWPESFSPATYASHPDAAVRREAIKIMLKHERLRERGIVIGLGDADERIVGLAMGSALKSCPVPAVPILMRRADDASLSAELRARGIRLVAASGVEAGLPWLIKRSLRKHWLFRTPRLREKSLELLAAVGGIAAYWHEAPEAAVVLGLVARSTDEDIRRASSGRGAAA